MKSADGKKRWRKFIEVCVAQISVFPYGGDIKPCLSRYEGKVTDHNFGSLIRMNAEEEYSESNTVFGAFSELAS